MNPTRKEINALVDLLEQDWETPEELAKALIKALDEARTDRTTYVGVMVFGPHFATAIGPYSGAKSADNALKKHPGATIARHVSVVPLMSPEGVDAHLKEVG